VSRGTCLNEGVPTGENAERVTDMGERRERDKVRTAGGAQERWTGRSPSTWPWQAACRLSVKPDPDPRLTEAQHGLIDSRATANPMHDGRKHVRERNAHSGTPDTTPNERDADAQPITPDAAVGH